MTQTVPSRPLALILDFGAVITKTVFEIPQAVGIAFDLPPDAFPWRGPLAPETDELWSAMQRDELSEREYWARRAAEIGRLGGRSIDTRAFMLATYEAAGPAAFRPEIETLIVEARAAGMKIGVLTNELELFHGKKWMDSLPVLKHVDALVDATNTRILKPDPRAYQAIAAALRVPIESSVFVDDQMRNVAGARDAGMPAIHFRVEDVGGSLDEIRTALGFELPNKSEVVHVRS
jgi:putative hydrolase of the HAD superfamily